MSDLGRDSTWHLRSVTSSGNFTGCGSFSGESSITEDFDIVRLLCSELSLILSSLLLFACSVFFNKLNNNNNNNNNSDVCLEAEASPRGSLEAENLLSRPRLDVLMPRLGLASPRDYCLGLASVLSLLPRSWLALWLWRNADWPASWYISTKATSDNENVMQFNVMPWTSLAN